MGSEVSVSFNENFNPAPNVMDISGFLKGVSPQSKQAIACLRSNSGPSNIMPKFGLRMRVNLKLFPQLAIISKSFKMVVRDTAEMYCKLFRMRDSSANNRTSVRS